MCLTQWKISSPIIHRGLNMWRNYVFLIIFRAVSFVRFDSAVHKEWLKIAFRTHITVSSPCSHNVYKSFRKRDEVPLRPARLTSLLPRCDFPKCPTKVFRISFSVLRSQYAAVLQPEALVASVSWHSHNTGRFALLSERITHFACIYHESLLPFIPFFITF